MKSKVKKDRRRTYSEKIASFYSLFGSLSNSDVKPLSIKKMNEQVGKGMFSKRDRA